MFLAHGYGRAILQEHEANIRLAQRTPCRKNVEDIVGRWQGQWYPRAGRRRATQSLISKALFSVPHSAIRCSRNTDSLLSKTTFPVLCAGNLPP